MSALEQIRAQARALLPGPCFLHRDQQLRALFVTDFPRRQPDAAQGALLALSANGFCVTEEKGLWRIDLSREAQCAFLRALPAPALPDLTENTLPLHALCRRLMSQGSTAPEQQPWDIVRLALLRLDAGQTAQLINELSGHCAVLKRKKAPLPTSVVALLIHHYEEERAC